MMDEQANLEKPEVHLAGLDNQFMDGIARLEKRDIDGAAELFRRILQTEPRLAEPRIEMARILIETQQIDEAEAEIREAIRILENGGQWLEILSEKQVQSVAYGLLAETLRIRAEADEVVFGEPDTWRAIVDESHAAFRKARELDPDNSHAEYWASNFDIDANQSDDSTDEP
jgi:tetratricopeptide (TPR) repeat protein